MAPSYFMADYSNGEEAVTFLLCQRRDPKIGEAVHSSITFRHALFTVCCDNAIYVEPSKIFTAPSTPRTERKQPRMGGLETSEKSAFSPYSSPQQHLSYGE
ncbi:hypothetical protein RB195_014178 [Necator americanus]|uniref:Uncharacterized protein n=1 Tax=Necator americanus TaxID=51031 RepID=A0ABR1DYZ3_NECAM